MLEVNSGKWCLQVDFLDGFTSYIAQKHGLHFVRKKFLVTKSILILINRLLTIDGTIIQT